LDNRILSIFVGLNWEFKETFSVTFVDDTLKKISNQHKEEGKVGHPAYPPLAMKVLVRNSIKQNRRGYRDKNSLNPVTPSFIKF